MMIGRCSAMGRSRGQPMRRWRAAPSSCAIVQGLRQLTGSASSSAAPHPWTFDADTAITGLGQHAYRGHVTDRWSVGDAPNGGYLMSMAISAARKELRFRDPLSVSVHFTAKAVEGAEAELQVDVLHSGRTSQTAQVWLRQEGALRSVYLLTFGDLKAFKGLNHVQLSAPDLPPVAECVDVSAALTRAAAAMHTKLSIYGRVELRASPDSPFVQSAMRGVADAGGRAVLEGWAAFSDHRPPCLRSMALFNDAYPPPVLCLSPLTPWVPTTELTLHCWTRPTPASSDTGPWLRVRFVTDVVRGGLLRADGEVWSADGTTLHATSRQLARLLTPRRSTTTHSSKG